MPSETLIDPAWLVYEHPRIADRFKVVDTYFEEEAPEDPRATALDAVLATLPPPMEEVIALRIHTGLSYREIATRMGWYCGTPPYPNGKRAWKTVRRALAQLRHLIETDPDLLFLNPGSDD